jgi:hypothetical protein
MSSLTFSNKVAKEYVVSKMAGGGFCGMDDGKAELFGGRFEDIQGFSSRGDERIGCEYPTRSRCVVAA